MKRKRNKKKNTFLNNLFLKLHKFKDTIFEVDDGNSNKSSFSIFEVIFIVIISIMFGIVIGYIITYSRIPMQSKAHSNLHEIVSTYNNILDSYYDDVDSSKLADAAIKGMVESLDDPYSNFMDIDTASKFNESIDGSFVGIGVVVLFENDKITIIEIMDSSPAKKAGLKVNDVILKVDDKDVNSLTNEEFLSNIRGKLGTKVKITVKRGEEEKEYTVTRGTIEVMSVSHKLLEEDNKNIGYIKIDSFAANTSKQFKKSLKKLENKSIDSLIIDLRNNPGGHLSQAREILNLFFPKKTILYKIEKKKSNENVYSQTSEKREYPVVVLINHESASAAEVFASCFKDNYKKGTIIGVTSYGKGTVQRSQSLLSGTSIKYTTQKWLTSKGEWLNQKGIEPDIIVEQVVQDNTDNSYLNDSQLQKALELLKES